ncbi:hypothetical protein GCM10022206_84920 [Streptomyces chiangmaiensis]
MGQALALVGQGLEVPLLYGIGEPGKLFQDLAPVAGDGLLSTGQSIVAERVDPLVVPRLCRSKSRRRTSRRISVLVDQTTEDPGT